MKVKDILKILTEMDENEKEFDVVLYWNKYEQATLLVEGVELDHRHSLCTLYRKIGFEK